MGELSEFLIKECRERDLSWRKASLKAGLDQTAISRFIRGTRPSPISCAKLADYFGYSLDHILVLAGHRNDAFYQYESNKDGVFLAVWKRLNPDEQDRVIRFARNLERTRG